MANWYLGSTLWTAVPAWSAAATATIGDFIRQTGAVTVGNERVWRCTTGGTTGGSQPSWILNKAGTTNDNGVVWTEVTGNSTYGWSAPHARLANAFAWMAAGDVCWMSDAHAETQATSNTLTSPGTATAPCQVLCVDDSAAPPTALATTGTISNTGSSNLSLAGFLYSYGVTYISGSNNNTAHIQALTTVPWWWKIENGSFQLNSSASTSRINLGTTSANTDDHLIELVNSTVSFGHAGHGITVRVPFTWIGGSLIGTTPTTLFQTPTAGNSANTVVRAVDLSSMGSGTNLVDASVGNYNQYLFEKCKLGSSVVVASGTIVGQGAVRVDLVNCDSADTNNRFASHRYQGVVTQEIVIVRTGGASADGIGVSRKMVANANAKRFSPLVFDGIILRNLDVGSPITITVEVVTDNVTLKDNEAWIEVEYLGTSGFPLALLATDGSDALNAGTNQTSSSETWTTTGLGTPVKQALAVTVTPEEAGDIRVRVMLGKASTTMYVCPKLTVS